MMLLCFQSDAHFNHRIFQCSLLGPTGQGDATVKLDTA